MITYYSEKIVDILIQNSKIIADKEQRAVYVYGLECILNTSITLFILCTWGIISHSLLETMSWIVAFTLLRHHSGGIHANSHFSCIIYSSLLGFSNYYVMKTNNLVNNHTLLTYIFLFTGCILFAPIESAKTQLRFEIFLKHKICSTLIILLGYIIIHYLPDSINNSITYGFLCGTFLYLLSVLKKILS